MGNSNNEEKKLVNNTYQVFDNMSTKKKNIEKTILKEEISKREGNDKNNPVKTNFILNIYLYSNDKIKNELLYSFNIYNSKVFDWKIKGKLIGFSKENNEILIDKCEKDFQDKKFAIVVVIPIKSISNFKNLIEDNEKDILFSFNELNEEQQPFFLFIDEEEKDFNCIKETIRFNPNEDKKDDKKLYLDFLEMVNGKINIYKDKGEDFQIKADFDYIYDDIKINKLKEYILKKKKKLHDFEIFVNDKLFYKVIYGIELFDINDKNNFEEKLKEEFLSYNKLKISLRLYNVNDEYLDYYETFKIQKVEFFSYIFQKELLNIILSNKKYAYLDKRNLNVIRERQSPKNYLLKYTGYYNQIGDILFYNQLSFGTIKINIAIGGFMGSGKSTLINTILGEKRCLEGQGGSMTNYISQYSFHEYPINLVDFPGFRAKQKGENNTSLFIKEIESKISDFKKLNEVFHCFLFCIKFQDRIFDENDEDTLEVFKAITKLKIRTYFIVTNSEKEDSNNFKRFKRIIKNNLNKIEFENLEIKKKIFGDDLDKNIIPILAKDKEFFGFKAKAFGLDNLFKILYEYFEKKRINYDKKIFLDEPKLNEFIENNELLKVFESKNKLCKDFKDKIQKEIGNFLMTLFLKAPKYIYTFSEESLFEILNELIDHFSFLLDYYLKQQSNKEILGKLNSFPQKELIKSFFSEENMKEITEEAKKLSKEIKTKIPWYAKLFFPVLSPFYYLFGTPIVKFFSIKLFNYFFKEFDESKIEDFIYELYFESIINDLNKGVEALDINREKFEQNYIIKNVEEVLLSIIVDKNDNIDLNEFTKIFTESINNNINPLNIFRQYYNEKLYFYFSDGEKQRIEQKKKKIFEASRDIIKQQIKFPENDILIESEKDEQKLIDYILSKYNISNLIAERKELLNDSELGRKESSKFHKHILVYSNYEMKDPEYDLGDYYCDICRKAFSKNVNNYHCKPCHFDLCAKCFKKGQ